MMLRSWRLYSWMRLIWMSNSASGSSLHADALADQRCKPHLVGALDRGELLAESGIIGKWLQRRQLLGVIEEPVADGLA